jgi:hypothetical protein
MTVTSTILHSAVPLVSDRPGVHPPSGRGMERMSREPPGRSRGLLARFHTPAGSEAALVALVESARPHVRRQLRQRCGDPELVEDLCAETLRRLVETSRRSREPGAAPIGDLVGYAGRVAETVFADHLRRVRPNWCRLKRRVVDLLDGRGGCDWFARWRNRWGLRRAWLGGLQAWSGRAARSTPHYLALCADLRPFCTGALEDRDPAVLPLHELLRRLFEHAGTPVEVDELTSHLAVLRRVEDSRELSLEELDGGGADVACAASDNPAAAVIQALASDALRAELWIRICDLPVRQRAALLLCLSPDELLLLAGTIGRVAGALEMSVEALGEVWRRLPAPDDEIAALLEVTRKQAANLRKCARERLARWLARSPWKVTV